MIKKLKLPFSFDSEKLQDDLKLFQASEWTPHFNQFYYEGDWSVIPLRVAKNAVMEIYPDPTAEEFEFSRYFARCSYIPEVVNSFQCPLETVRLMRLSAGSNILEHRDYKTGFEDGLARIHIPVQTNRSVRFKLDGEVVPMNSGDAWYLNFNLPHSVHNESSEDRIHLVLDCVVNDWLTKFFAQ